MAASERVIVMRSPRCRCVCLCVCVYALKMSDTEFAFCFTGLFYEGFPELGWIQVG